VDGEPQLTSGDTIADYTVESLIGRGGMGEVFRAADLRLARAVALKVLTPALAASIDHPNVIPIYSAGEADGHVYIAMRLVEGSDLRAELRRRGRLEPAP
jgi:serine/threonine protein kinase